MSKQLISLLLTWYHRQKRVLPWRENPSLYAVWISEIMLQQTQVVTVLPYFEKFLARFPTVKKLAEGPLDDVLKFWAGLGYYSRAERLHQAAVIIAKQNKFPQTLEEWLEVPGVGPYTAGAICSIALNQPTPILDGNVERVLSRWFRIGTGEFYKQELWKKSADLVKLAHAQKHPPRDFNQALMELGALICTPKPRCLLCPVHQYCEAYQQNETEVFPPKKIRPSTTLFREKAFLIINSQQEILLVQSRDAKWRKSLWDLPSNLENIEEIVGVVKKPREIPKKITEIQYHVTRYLVRRSIYFIYVKNHSRFRVASPGRKEGLKSTWVSIEELKNMGVGAPLKKLFQRISLDELVDELVNELVTGRPSQKSRE